MRPGLSLGVRPALRLAELLSRQQQRRAARLARLRAGQQEDERASRRRRRLQRSQRPGGDRRRAALAAGRPDRVRDHGSGLSGSVCVGGGRGGARRRASCGWRPTCRFRRRCSTASASIINCRRRLTLSVTYTGARGYHLFRSRDVNAPPPPLYLTRPDPAYGVVRAGRVDRPPGDRLAAGDAARQGDALVQRPDAVHAEPRLQRHRAASASFPANDYDLSGEWARADFDRRHRFNLLGRDDGVQGGRSRRGLVG